MFVHNTYMCRFTRTFDINTKNVRSKYVLRIFTSYNIGQDNEHIYN